MRLNDAHIIYSDEQIDNATTTVKPLSECGESLSRSITRVALVVDDIDNPAVDRLKKAWFEHEMSVATVKLTSKIRVINFLRNLPRMVRVPYATKPDNSYRGAILCAAGSGLLENLNEIVRLQRWGYMIAATNRAVKVLSDNGVLADLVFCSESRDVRSTLGSSRPTIFDVTASPDNVSYVDSPNFVCTLDPAFDELMFRAHKRVYPVGPSVTSMALSWLFAARFQDIMTIGWTACGLYEKGALDNEPEKDLPYEVPCYDGVNRGTTPQLLDEINWFNTYVHSNVFTANKTAAIRKNMTYMPISLYSHEKIVPGGLNEPIKKEIVLSYLEGCERKLDRLNSAIEDKDDIGMFEAFSSIAIFEAYVNADIYNVYTEETTLKRYGALREMFMRTIPEFKNLIAETKGHI